MKKQTDNERDLAIKTATMQFEQGIGYVDFDKVLGTVFDAGHEAALSRQSRLNREWSPFLDPTWPLELQAWGRLEIFIAKLIESADILLHKHDYDGHGWEEHEYAFRAAKKYMEHFYPQPQPDAEPTADGEVCEEPTLHFDPQRRVMTMCQSDSDGDCEWKHCPQLRDGEPKATRRHCPLDNIGVCECGHLRSDHDYFADECGRRCDCLEFKLVGAKV